MRPPAQIVAETVRDAKTIPRLVALTLVLVQMIEGKIADFNLVALTGEAAALAELTEMVKDGWMAIGVYIITASSSGQARQISCGPLREFIGDAQVEKFLTNLVDCSPLYYKAAESLDWTPISRLKWVGDGRTKPARFSA
jgi:hypothetical protein